MNIQRCSVCDRPFFPEVSTTSRVPMFDPTACPSCNALAKKNSKPVILPDDKTL